MTHAVEQAKILVKDAKLKVIDTITVDFNPSEYTISYTPKYKENSGGTQGASVPEFLKDAAASLSLKLTLDGFMQKNTLDETKAADISGKVRQLRALTKINEELHKPPICEFQWGSVAFAGYANNLSVQYTLFSSEGKPLRAAVSFTITGVDDKAPALRSPDRTRRRVLPQDMPLYMIAYEAYNDCGEWRRIAVANGIRNPRRTEAGTILRVPPLERDTP